MRDLAVLKARLEAEPEAGVRAAIVQRISDLVVAPGQDSPDLATRLAWLRSATDRALIERAACEAAEPELRRAALEAVTRQGLLGDRAIEDPDAAVRSHAAQLVTQESTLRRVIDATRTRDKALHHALVARLKNELLARKDPQAVADEATDICLALEALADRHHAEATEVPEALTSRWAPIADQVPQALQRRHRAAVERLTGTPPAPDPVPDPPAAAPPPPSEPQPEVAAPSPEWTALGAGIRELAKLRPQRVTLKALERLADEWRRLAPGPDGSDYRQAGEAIESIKAKRVAWESAVDQSLAQVDASLERYRTELAEGHLHNALEQRKAINELAGELRAARRWKAVQDELNRLHGRLQELRDWLHWSNNTIRQQLIDEMELLPKADLHPDARLQRLRELQARWQELEASEQIPGEPHFAAAPSLWRRFRSAGNQAFETTKPYLDKRSEIFERRFEQVKQLATRLNELARSPEPDLQAVGAALREARKELQALSGLPHALRGKAATRLKKAMEPANALLQKNYEAVEKAKRKLIRSAEQLAFLEDRDEAIRAAKALQAEWKSAGALWRSRENQLWKAFREHVDPLFESLEIARESERQQRNERIESQRAIVAELDTLLAGADDTLEARAGKIEGLRHSFAEFRHPQKDLAARFERGLRDYHKRVDSFHEREARAQRRRWWDKSALLHEARLAVGADTDVETSLQDIRERWPQGDFGTDTDRALDQALDMLCNDGSEVRMQPASLEAARGLCIQLEFLAGLPSPESERQQRMAYQVERLSQTMSGASREVSALDEARLAEQSWLTLAYLEAAEYDSAATRIRAAAIELLGDFNVE